VSHPLVARLLDEFGYPEITLANHDEFAAKPGMNVLFFPGDARTVRDATDVAVVLPELVQAFQGKLRPGVVTDFRGDGTQLRKHYGFRRWPALVFVRGGAYVGAITGIQNWSDYLEEIGELLLAPPRRPPDLSIPVLAS
jgi:hydrogenase-1 operon protein HyaE